VSNVKRKVGDHIMKESPGGFFRLLSLV